MKKSKRFEASLSFKLFMQPKLQGRPLTSPTSLPEAVLSDLEWETHQEHHSLTKLSIPRVQDLEITCFRLNLGITKKWKLIAGLPQSHDLLMLLQAIIKLDLGLHF
jgi:hypothetical protein